MSTLGAEIAAQRLMAPFFGSSTVIWANTIAVVLLALDNLGVDITALVAGLGIGGIATAILGWSFASVESVRSSVAASTDNVSERRSFLTTGVSFCTVSVVA